MEAIGCCCVNLLKHRVAIKGQRDMVQRQLKAESRKSNTSSNTTANNMGSNNTATTAKYQAIDKQFKKMNEVSHTSVLLSMYSTDLLSYCVIYPL